MPDNRPTILTPREVLDELFELRRRKDRRDWEDMEDLDRLRRKLDAAWAEAERTLKACDPEPAPPGWQLVPIKPPREVIEALCRGTAGAVWPGDYGPSAQRLRREHAAEAWDLALQASPPAPKVT